MVSWSHQAFLDLSPADFEGQALLGLFSMQVHRAGGAQCGAWSPCSLAMISMPVTSLLLVGHHAGGLVPDSVCVLPTLLDVASFFCFFNVFCCE